MTELISGTLNELSALSADLGSTAEKLQKYTYRRGKGFLPDKNGQRHYDLLVRHPLPPPFRCSHLNVAVQEKIQGLHSEIDSHEQRTLKLLKRKNPGKKAIQEATTSMQKAVDVARELLDYYDEISTAIRDRFPAEDGYEVVEDRNPLAIELSGEIRSELSLWWDGLVEVVGFWTDAYEQGLVPLPSRELSFDEKCVVLAIVHDVGCPCHKPINPWQMPKGPSLLTDDPADNSTAISYLLSCRSVKAQNEAFFTYVRRFLKDVTDEFRQRSGNEPQEPQTESMTCTEQFAATASKIQPKKVNRSGRRQDWNHALKFVANFKAESPKATDREAIDKYRNRFTQRKCPSVNQLKSARSYRKNKH